MTYDLIIRGGNVADGRGTPLFKADIAIKDGKIVEIGSVAGTGVEEIDARGKLVAPGFVDVHSHYDGQAIWDDRLLCSGWHGVTTTVMGNCGVGFAPVRAKDRDLLVEMMEGVEDIPGNVMREGLPWDWSTFPEFMDALERRPHDIDMCAQLPHSALRVYVMGDRAVRREEGTADDIAEMRRLAEEAMHAGAFGFTTSRTQNHRTLAGELIPSFGATMEEFAGVAMGLKDAGKGVLQIIADLPPEGRAHEFAIMRGMVEASGRPLSATVLQRNSDPDGFRDFMNMIGGAVADGLPMHAQVAPRPIGTLFSLDMHRNPFCFHPSYKTIEHEPLDNKVAIMRDPAFRAKILAESADHHTEQQVRRVQSFDYLFPFGDPPNYTPSKDDSVTAIAAREGRSVFEVAYDLLLEDDGRAMLFAPNNNYADYTLNACKEMMENPNAIVALADGGAHVEHIMDVSYSTYLLTYWGRDRPEGALDVSWLIKRMTGDAAAKLGLLDRGILAPGYKADINVIDHERLRIGRPYMVNDLPMGAKRLLQEAEGYEATIVSGQTIYREGKATDALPGKLVRGAQAAPGT
jgi:N-acyl-D-aspartate/D-glutamate deacylase